MVEGNTPETQEEGNSMLMKSLAVGAVFASIYVYRNYLSCAPAPKHP